MAILADDHVFRKPYALSFYTDVAFMVWEEWRAKMSEADGETYKGTIEQALKQREEFRRGIGINKEIPTVVGKKEPK